MIAFNNMSVTFGQLVASAIGAGLAQAPGEAWRGTVGIGALPAIGLAIMLLWCPESPRQLVAHGHYEKAEQVLLRIYPSSTPEQRHAKVKAIELSIHEATSSLSKEPIWTTFRRIFTTPATGRAVACMYRNGHLAARRFQHFDVLFGYAILHCRLYERYRRGYYRLWHELRLLYCQSGPR